MRKQKQEECFDEHEKARCFGGPGRSGGRQPAVWFGFAKKEYVYQQFETAESVTSVTVQDASANVTIQAADTDHITVRYGTLPDEEASL